MRYSGGDQSLSDLDRRVPGELRGSDRPSRVAHLVLKGLDSPDLRAQDVRCTPPATPQAVQAEHLGALGFPRGVHDLDFPHVRVLARVRVDLREQVACYLEPVRRQERRVRRGLDSAVADSATKRAKKAR